MAEKIEEPRQRVVKVFQFKDLTPEMQAQMLAPTAPKRKVSAAPDQAAQTDQQKELPMTLERAKKLMSTMNRAKKLEFIREIINKKDPPIHRDIIIAIGQSAMTGMDKADMREFINILATAQRAERAKVNAKRENELVSRLPTPEVVAVVEEAEEAAAQTEENSGTTLTLPNSAEETTGTAAKVAVKPKAPVHRANGTKPKHKGKKHSAVATQNHKAAKTKPADVPEETQSTGVIDPEIVTAENSEPEKEIIEQQILPGTVISSAPKSLSDPLPPIEAMTKTETPGEKRKAAKKAVLVNIKKRPTVAKIETVAPEEAPKQTDFRKVLPKADPIAIDIGDNLTDVARVIPAPIVEKPLAEAEIEEVKIVAKGSSTSIKIGAESFSLSGTKLVKMQDGSIRLEIVAEKVIVKDPIPLPKKANEFEMTFGFETKTEVEKLIEKPCTDGIFAIVDGDNFTRYVKYQNHADMADVVRYYVKGRQMSLQPQYFVSVDDVPSRHVRSFRDQHAHTIRATGYFNVSWTRIKKVYEDESMFDPDLPLKPKDRLRGYGDADVASFLLHKEILDSYDTLLLFTHDHHFVSTVKYLQSLGKKVELYHTGWWWTHRDLISACDAHTDITKIFAPKYPPEILEEIRIRKK